MWSSYLNNQTDEESKSKEAREEEAYARKRSRDVMTTMCVKNTVISYYFSNSPRKLMRSPAGALTKESAIELFDLNHRVAVANMRAINIHNVTEEELNRFFKYRCNVLGMWNFTLLNLMESLSFLDELGSSGCPGVELQDVHEAYQLILKIIKARKGVEPWKPEKVKENGKKKLKKKSSGQKNH